MRTIPERDWKKLQAIHDEKLALLCERILAAAEAIAKQREGQEHQAFLRLWKEIGEGNRLIELLFDGLARTNALFRLTALRVNGLLSDADLALFSEETQQAITRI